jgi:LacI family transcriptional regulator
MAVSLLLHLLEGDPVESNHVEVATSLVVRGSTGPPPAEPGAGEAVQGAADSI